MVWIRAIQPGGDRQMAGISLVIECTDEQAAQIRAMARPQKEALDAVCEARMPEYMAAKKLARNRTSQKALAEAEAAWLAETQPIRDEYWRAMRVAVATVCGAAAALA
jgi:hypothetical protein